MNRSMIDRLAHALLYEGYILYPYRPSVKNRQRWTFGGLYPKPWSDAQNGTDAWFMQTQCLATGNEDTRIAIGIRFLHLLDRTVGEFNEPLADLPADPAASLRPTQSLMVDDREFQPWQEAVERDVDFGEIALAELLSGRQERRIDFPYRVDYEPLRNTAGQFVGMLTREQQPIDATVELSAAAVTNGLFQITVTIRNRSDLAEPRNATRDQALMRSLISTHTLLGVERGEFVSLTDPPVQWKAHASACENVGAWPILLGLGTEHDTLLSSPIILSDYPQLAPESPGDLFDSTEIDEILTLRIMTLTDEEKRTAAGMDDRVQQLLARTDALARDQLMSLHGTLRGLRPVPTEQPHG